MTDKKVAIITAAGKGIGAGIARELAKDYQVVLLSNSGGAESLASELDGIAVTGSVTNPDDLQKLVNSTMEAYGRIDAVVNNTGHPPKGEILAISDEDWHSGLDMVMLNVVRMARLVTPIMIKQGGGAIVNISTATAYEPSLNYPVSTTIRAALGAYTKLFSDQYGTNNIRMNNLMPGFVDNYPVTDENLKRIPMKRYAKLEEIAKTCKFLLSDEAAYITGQNIRIDGGMTRSV